MPEPELPTLQGKSRRSRVFHGVQRLFPWGVSVSLTQTHLGQGAVRIDDRMDDLRT